MLVYDQEVCGTISTPRGLGPLPICLVDLAPTWLTAFARLTSRTKKEPTNALQTDRGWSLGMGGMVCQGISCPEQVGTL